MKKLILACAALALAPAVAFGTIVVDDSWADGDRAKTGPLDADWWSASSTSGNSVEVDVGALGMVTGTSGRGIHATFAPQTLSIGDSITATYTFMTPATVGTGKSTAFRVALMDLNNPALADDLSSSSSTPNPLYVGQPGYMSDFDVNTGATADISIREHDQASALGRFLGTTSEWTNSGGSSDAGYTFDPNTEYVGVFSITRTGADSVDVFSSMSQGGGLMDSHTRSYSSNIANNYGMLGFWANSNTFGSTNTDDPDNGITFSNVTVEYMAIPEPGTMALLIGGFLALGVLRRRK